ncbi:MAG: UbiA family prenyltransferase [Chitinophagaceae bacterium]|nr:UbiA family prenyltransferase [Chitinophagaceae bacterium]
MMQLLRKAFHFLIFSSIYVSVCSVLITFQTNQLFTLQYNSYQYLLFVFFSTICSYNFHWYLTREAAAENRRISWTQQHRHLHILLFLAGAAGAAWYFFYFSEHWVWLAGAALLTFLYSAPKLSYQPFIFLRRIAIGKTIYLAFVWMYTTTFIPFLLSEQPLEPRSILFCVNRFFFLYAICIVFDYRDRVHDKKQGIKSMITYFSEQGIDALFYLSITLFTVGTGALYLYHFPAYILFSQLLPAAMLVWLYPVAKKNFSDYIYYFALDGLIMLSPLIQLIYYF